MCIVRVAQFVICLFLVSVCVWCVVNGVALVVIEWAWCVAWCEGVCGVVVVGSGCGVWCGVCSAVVVVQWEWCAVCVCVCVVWWWCSVVCVVWYVVSLCLWCV